jgi:hypothetical protein
MLHSDGSFNSDNGERLLGFPPQIPLNLLLQHAPAEDMTSQQAPLGWNGYASRNYHNTEAATADMLSSGARETVTFLPISLSIRHGPLHHSVTMAPPSNMTKAEKEQFRKVYPALKKELPKIKKSTRAEMRSYIEKQPELSKPTPWRPQSSSSNSQLLSSIAYRASLTSRNSCCLPS